MRHQEVADHLWALWFIWLPFGLTRATQIVLFDRVLDAPRRWWLCKVNPHDYPPGDDRLSLIAYLSMCIFCMSVDIGLLISGLLLLPVVSDLVVILLAVLAAAWFVPVLDHWGDKLLADKTALTPDEIAAWSHGGVKVTTEVSIDDQLAALEGNDDGET